MAGVTGKYGSGTWRDDRYPGCACDVPSPACAACAACAPERGPGVTGGGCC
ncbi:MAG TPA: hypothetical protein VGG16_26965 [Streptosporangiaceae bacterium]